MSYLDVITLSQAKTYLRIDDDQNETDSEIENMIKGALSFIEKRTNHLMYARDKEYFGDYNVNVYDFPVNTIPIDNISLRYSTFQNITTIDRSVILNVGYILPTDIPSELIESALQIIKVWYFEAEKQTNTSLIPESVMQAIDINKRFFV